jgi:hypothetical protein
VLLEAAKKSQGRGRNSPDPIFFSVHIKLGVDGLLFNDRFALEVDDRWELRSPPNQYIDFNKYLAAPPVP